MRTTFDVGNQAAIRIDVAAVHMEYDKIDLCRGFWLYAQQGTMGSTISLIMTDVVSDVSTCAEESGR